MCAVTGRSQTLQYRSEGFGAVAHPSAGLGMECDSGSTLCRATVMVSMLRVYNLPSFKPSKPSVIELVSDELLEIVKLKGPAP